MRHLRYAESGFSHKDVFSSDSAEINSTYRDHDYRTLTDEVPVVDIFLMKGELNGELVQVLKDDGCNTMLVHLTFSEITANCLEF